MDFIRSLHWRHYDKTRGRFVSEAFEPSDNGGISVVDKGCIGQHSSTICEHLWKYYSKFIDSSAVYWEVTKADLPDGHTIKHELSDLGDECHVNIYGISNNRAKKFFKKRQQAAGLDEFRICEKFDCSPRKLEKSDIEGFVLSVS